MLLPLTNRLSWELRTSWAPTQSRAAARSLAHLSASDWASATSPEILARLAAVLSEETSLFLAMTLAASKLAPAARWLKRRVKETGKDEFKWLVRKKWLNSFMNPFQLSPFSSCGEMSVLLQHGGPAGVQLLQDGIFCWQSGFDQSDGLPEHNTHTHTMDSVNI